jgi:4-diphosphocytidyl-2-C-methyl-D-erythritol kinase
VNELQLTCPAKVNLALRVGPLSDDYHPIRSWMMRINLVDDLYVKRLEDDAPSQFHISWADDAPRPGVVDWPIEDDLACLAAQITEQHIGRPMPVMVRLVKRIPTGAGLGGGSSDGAAMLTALDRLFDLNMTRDQKWALAGLLGSDVPFFFEPTGSAVASGRGEQIEPVAAPAIHLALILPNVHCSTGGVYGHFDALGSTPSVDDGAVDQLVAAGHVGPDDPFNDLAEPACDLVPELRQIRNRCAQVVDQSVHVTGSGAGLFVVAADANEAQAMAQTIASETGEVAIAVQGP